MQKNLKKIKDLVKKEAYYLRHNTTYEERKRLAIRRLIPTNRHNCIYGQLTGSCDSERAISLMKKGCKRVFRRGHFFHLQDPQSDATIKCSKYLNRRYFWSPIEVFIASCTKEQSANIIKYIKGNLHSLNID